MIARNFYSPDDPATADMLANYNQFYDTLDDAIDSDLRDMLHNGNSSELLDASLIDSLTDDELTNLEGIMIDNMPAIAHTITAIINRR